MEMENSVNLRQPTGDIVHSSIPQFPVGHFFHQVAPQSQLGTSVPWVGCSNTSDWPHAKVFGLGENKLFFVHPIGGCNQGVIESTKQLNGCIISRLLFLPHSTTQVIGDVMFVCMCVCVYVRVCVCVCVSVCLFVCFPVCMSVCLYACMSLCLSVCMYVCMHACMYVCLYLSNYLTI